MFHSGELGKDEEFCKTLSDKEPYYGCDGALKCLQDGEGDVAFFHTRDILMKYDTFSKEFDIVCKNGKRTLTWQNFKTPECRLTEEHPQVLDLSGCYVFEFADVRLKIRGEVRPKLSQRHSFVFINPFTVLHFIQDYKTGMNNLLWQPCTILWRGGEGGEATCGRKSNCLFTPKEPQ